MYAFGAMLSFTIAHLSVIRLRFKAPDFERPYTGPGNVGFRGASVPLFAVFGGFGTLLAFIVVTFLHLDVAVAGVGWLALGCVVYPIYRRRQGLDLTTTTKVAIPRPVVDHEAEYESVLVALESKAFSEGAMATAVRIAARRRRGIHVLVTIVVPSSSPLAARLPEQEAAAQAIIEQAKLIGGRRVTGHWTKVRAGQAGRTIVEEARAMRARAIVLPLAQRGGGGGALFPKTVETVLADRPCRVIIQSDPAPAQDGHPAVARRRRRPVRRALGRGRALSRPRLAGSRGPLYAVGERARPPPDPCRIDAPAGRADAADRRRADRLDARPRRRRAGRRGRHGRAVRARRRGAAVRRRPEGLAVERERLRVGAGDGAMDRTLGSAVLFSIVWVTLASAVYFSLGVVADHALGHDARRLPGRRPSSSGWRR